MNEIFEASIQIDVVSLVRAVGNLCNILVRVVTFFIIVILVVFTSLDFIGERVCGALLFLSVVRFRPLSFHYITFWMNV